MRNNEIIDEIINLKEELLNNNDYENVSLSVKGILFEMCVIFFCEESY